MKPWIAATLALFSSWALATESLPVKDGDFSCIDAATADRYIANFSIDIGSFGGKELCNPSVDSKKLFNDLQLIEQGRFGNATQNLFIKNFVNRDNYYRYLQDETRGIQRGNDVPFATAYNSGGYFTMQDGWAKLSTLGRVGVVLHEARHTEGFYHVPCTQGPYKGSQVQGCDTTVENGGSHAIEMEYYARVVVQGANFHPVYQDMARLMLLARSNFVFNSNPLSPHDALLARTETGFVRFKDGQREEWAWESAPPTAEPATLKRTSFGATLLENPVTALAVTLKDSHTAATVSDDYSYFKLLKIAPPTGLTDFEEVDADNKRYVVALDNRANAFGYIFDRGRWSSPQPLSGAKKLLTSDPSGQKGLYALFENSTYCAIDLRTLRCGSTANPWPLEAQQFVGFQNTLLKLSKDGVVTGPDGSPWPDLRGVRTLDLIRVPAYNVFDKALIN